MQWGEWLGRRRDTGSEAGFITFTAPAVSVAAVMALAASMWASAPDRATETTSAPRPVASATPWSIDPDVPELAVDNVAERLSLRTRITGASTGPPPASTTTVSEDARVEFANDLAADGTIILDAPPAVGKSMLFPVKAPVTSPFGLRLHPILGTWRLHTGTDFGADCGTPVVATRAGTVASAGFEGGYGNRIVIDHGRVAGHALKTAYNHLSVIGVRPGMNVAAGSPIGRVGTTGLSTGCHLHFEVMLDGSYTDPMPFLDGLPSTAITTVPDLTPKPSPSASANPSMSVAIAPTPGASTRHSSTPTASATPSATPTPTTTPTPTASASPSPTTSASPTPVVSSSPTAARTASTVEPTPSTSATPTTSATPVATASVTSSATS